MAEETTIYRQPTSAGQLRGYYNGDSPRTAFELARERRLSTKQPNWRQLVAKHGNASTAYFRSKVESKKASFGSYRLETELSVPGGGKVIVYSHFTMSNIMLRTIPLPIGTIPISTFSNKQAELNTAALAKLKNKLRTVNADYNALVPLYELKEMRGLIRQLAQSGTETVKALVDLKHGRLRSAHKKASDLWLMWSFGASPMIADAAAAAEAVAAHLNEINYTRHLVGKESGEEHSSWSESVESVYSSGSIKIHLVQEHEVKYKGGVLVGISNANNYSAFAAKNTFDHYGISGGGFAEAMWELTPYSWLVDYFTNAGDVISDTFRAPGASTFYLDRIVKCKSKYTWSGGYEARNMFGYSKGSISPGELTTKYYSREPIAALPATNFHFKSFDEIGSHAINKLLNLTSLLARR